MSITKNNFNVYASADYEDLLGEEYMSNPVRHVNMKMVRVDKANLLEKIKENRAKHAEAYEQAVVGYRQELVEKLKEMLKDAKAGKNVAGHVGLQAPQHNLRDYDRAIAMLEASLDSELELDQNEFSNYYMDEWHWKDQFTALNSTYIAKANFR